MGQPSKVGQFILELRVAHRMSQRRFANKWGVSPAYVGHVESGKIQHLGLEKAKQLCVAFGIKPKDLFAEVGSDNSQTTDSEPGLNQDSGS